MNCRRTQYDEYVTESCHWEEWIHIQEEATLSNSFLPLPFLIWKGIFSKRGENAARRAGGAGGGGGWGEGGE